MHDIGNTGVPGVDVLADQPSMSATPRPLLTSVRVQRSDLRIEHQPRGQWIRLFAANRLLLALDMTALLAPLAVLGAFPSPLGGVFVVATLALLATGGLYRPRLTLSVLDDAPKLLGRGLAATAVTWLLGWSTTAPMPGPVVVGASLVTLLLLRVVGYRTVIELRRRGYVRHPALVLGAGKVGRQVVGTLQSHHEIGLWPVGLLDDDPTASDTPQPVPVLGGTEELADAVLRTGAQVVIVAFGRKPESEMVRIIRMCDRLDCTMFFVPRLFEIGACGDVDHAWGIPLVRLRRTGLRTSAHAIKRVMDVTLAALALVALSPLLLAVAAAVRIEVGRGVIFQQTRIGIDGRPFTILKFRSLRDRDDTRASTEWSVAGSAYVGPVGRLLRATSLDELPQLWNVIRGDMSLVGPRPERPHFVDEFTRTHPHYMARHRVRAGLTGYAQVKGLRGDTSIADRLTFDNDYIENWSIWTDVKIMAWTLGCLARRSGS